MRYIGYEENREMAGNRSWRGLVQTRAQELLDSGREASVATLAKEVRDDMPWWAVGDCAYTAVAKEINGILRRGQVGEDGRRHKGFSIRKEDGTRVFQLASQAQLPGIVVWVREQTARRNALDASIIAGVEDWVEDHPEAGLTVSEIIRMAEPAP